MMLKVSLIDRTAWFTRLLGDYDHVSNGEFLKTLVGDRTEKRNLVLIFQSWKMTMDHYSGLGRTRAKLFPVYGRKTKTGIINAERKSRRTPSFTLHIPILTKG